MAREFLNKGIEKGIEFYSSLYSNILNNKSRSECERKNIGGLLNSLINEYEKYYALVNSESNNYDCDKFFTDSLNLLKNNFNGFIILKLENQNIDYLIKLKESEFNKNNKKREGTDSDLSNMISDLAWTLRMDKAIKVSTEEGNKWIIEQRLIFLRLLYSCWNDYGLHPDILKRDLKFALFNIVIYYKGKTKSDKKECRLFLSEKELSEEYINPYKLKLNLIIYGLTLKFESITRIRITRSFYQKNEAPFYQAKNMTYWSFDTESLDGRMRYFGICADVTNDYLKLSVVDPLVSNIELGIDLWNSDRLNTYLSNIDKSINEKNHERAVSLCYTVLEGFYKAFIKHNIPDKTELKEILEMSNVIKKYLKDKVELYPDGLFNQITNITHLIDKSRNMFSESHFHNEAEKWLAIFIKDSMNSIIRLLMSFIKDAE